MKRLRYQVDRKNAQHDQKISHVLILCDYKKLSFNVEKCLIDKFQYKEKEKKCYINLKKAEI